MNPDQGEPKALFPGKFFNQTSKIFLSKCSFPGELPKERFDFLLMNAENRCIIQGQLCVIVEEYNDWSKVESTFLSQNCFQFFSAEAVSR